VSYTITKHKNRYILIESSEPIDTRDRSTSADVIKAMDRQLGEVGRYELNPKAVFQYNTNVFILRVNRGHERKAILALSFIKELSGKKLGLYTIKISGTRRTLVEYCKTTYR
jgi:RNase P/RNase MRP subunit POP5